ncbi:MAG: DUF2892 domain-containing protein, partial [Candidatus Marinimicrobia bacterium]|nr:DUF2892 domain-containing protein [Candidatus Neomarinimicrobiota bacterium]
MKCNIGKTDKIVRWIVGLAVIVLGLYLRSWWGLLGLIPIITAVIGLCPLYLPFGINTCKTPPS